MSRDSTWLRYDRAASRLTLALHVQPNARRNEVAGLHGGALKVKIAAPAADNRANDGLVELLSGLLEVPKSAIVIRHGATSRRKVVEITGGPELTPKLAALAANRITNHDSRPRPPETDRQASSLPRRPLARLHGRIPQAGPCSTLRRSRLHPPACYIRMMSYCSWL